MNILKSNNKDTITIERERKLFFLIERVTEYKDILFAVQPEFLYSTKAS